MRIATAASYEGSNLICEYVCMVARWSLFGVSHTFKLRGVNCRRRQLRREKRMNKYTRVQRGEVAVTITTCRSQTPVGCSFLLVLSLPYFSLSLHLQPRNPCNLAIIMRETAELRLDSCESDFGCLPARMIHQSCPIMSIHNHPPSTIHNHLLSSGLMPHARKARLFLLRTRHNVPVRIHYHGSEPRGFRMCEAIPVSRERFN